MKAEPVSGVRPAVVSALPQPMTDSAFIADYAGERNYGFHTAIGTAEASGKEHHRRLRAGRPDPHGRADGGSSGCWSRCACRGASFPGTRSLWARHGCRAKGSASASPRWNTGKHHPGRTGGVRQRRAGGHLHPRLDGDRRGKEIGANMGSSLGSSINISTDAGAQLASDLGRGAIQGISQYISKKMRTVKVHLKSGYRVLLYQERNEQPKI